MHRKVEYPLPESKTLPHLLFHDALCRRGKNHQGQIDLLVVSWKHLWGTAGVPTAWMASSHFQENDSYCR